jgi:hypothetical protein
MRFRDMDPDRLEALRLRREATQQLISSVTEERIVREEARQRMRAASEEVLARVRSPRKGLAG